MKTKEMRELGSEERKEKLKDWRSELMEEYGKSAMGGSSPSPGKIRWIRKNIARMLTVMHGEGETNE